MEWVELCYAVMVMLACSVNGASRRQRDAALSLRLQSLTLRLGILEADLLQEKQTSQALKAEVDEVKSACRAASEATAKVRSEEGSVSDRAVKMLADLTRNTIRKDLDVIRSGLTAEKTRAVRTENAIKLCKETLGRYAPQFAVIGATLTRLEGRLAGLNKTVTAVSRNCSVCSTHALRPIKDVPSKSKADLCPTKVTLEEGWQDLDPVVCKHRARYAYYVIITHFLQEIDRKSHGAAAVVDTIITTGVNVNHPQRHDRLWVPPDCPRPHMESTKHYLIFTDTTPPPSDASSMSLKGSIIVDVGLSTTYRRKTDSSTRKQIARTMKRLLSGSWEDLCQ